MKFALGLLQLGLGFVAFWYGAQTADERGMVGAGLALPGLPAAHDRRTVPLAGRAVDGHQALAGAAGEHGDGHVVPGHRVLPVPGGDHRAVHRRDPRRRRRGIDPGAAQTVHVYGDVFGKIAISAVISALICFALAPLLTRWMHQGVDREHA